MKTNIEILEPLLKQARQLAARKQTTLRALIEQGLREVVTKKSESSFKLRSASYKGNGLQPHAQLAGWEKIREMAYEGHGG